MRFALRWNFDLTETDDHDDETLGEHVDRVMQELLNLEGEGGTIFDSAIGLDTENRRVEIEVSVFAADLEAAFAEAAPSARAAIRTAIHAAGGFTPGWGDTVSSAVTYEFIDVSVAGPIHGEVTAEEYLADSLS